MDKPSCSRFVKGIKIQKRFRFCSRDEYGTRSHRGGHECVRSTPLGRELALRTKLRIIMEFYKIGGIDEWDEYKQHLAAIAAALRRYKAARVERGLFHLVPMAKSAGFWILSPLRARPGTEREAIDKWRRQREKRAAAALRIENDRARAGAAHKKMSSSSLVVRPGWMMLYMGYLMSVCVLSCLIVVL